MPRAIFVEEFEDECRRKYCASCNDCDGMICEVCWIKDMFKEIEAAKEVDAIERKYGKWIYQFHEDEVGVTCSECEGYAESFARWVYDEGYRIDYSYCPNCGAQMDAGDE